MRKVYYWVSEKTAIQETVHKVVVSKMVAKYIEKTGVTCQAHSRQKK